MDAQTWRAGSLLNSGVKGSQQPVRTDKSRGARPPEPLADFRPPARSRRGHLERAGGRSGHEKFAYSGTRVRVAIGAAGGCWKGGGGDARLEPLRRICCLTKTFDKSPVLMRSFWSRTWLRGVTPPLEPVRGHRCWQQQPRSTQCPRFRVFILKTKTAHPPAHPSHLRQRLARPQSAHGCARAHSNPGRTDRR